MVIKIILTVTLNLMDSMISHKQQLGAGIYTIADISQLLSLPKSKVRKYLNEYWDERLGKKLFNETYSWSINNNIKAVNFYTLIELFTCFYLQEQGVSTKQILKSREIISKELNVPYPFASSNLLTDGKRIWYEFKDCIVNADGSKQTNFVEFISNFAEKIEFNSDKTAERFWPSGKESVVVIDPHHQFGQPVIEGTNINAEVIYSMYESGESINTIGILYDITEKDVRDVIRFYSKAA
jgi:uncharacterized protein (DUF433 family)